MADLVVDGAPSLDMFAYDIARLVLCCMKHELMYRVTYHVSELGRVDFTEISSHPDS